MSDLLSPCLRLLLPLLRHSFGSQSHSLFRYFLSSRTLAIFGGVELVCFHSPIQVFFLSGSHLLKQSSKVS